MGQIILWMCWMLCSDYKPNLLSQLVSFIIAGYPEITEFFFIAAKRQLFSWILSHGHFHTVNFCCVNRLLGHRSVPVPSQPRWSSASNVPPSVFTCSGCSLHPSSIQSSCTANSAGAPTQLQGQENCYIKMFGKMLTWISITCFALERNAARIFGNGLSV